MKKLILFVFLLFSSNIFCQYEVLIDKFSTDECTYPFIREGMKIQFLFNNNTPALVVSEYSLRDRKFVPIKAFYITDRYDNYNRDGYNWVYLREDTFGEFLINYNAKTKKATFSLKNSTCNQKFTFISGENSIKNKVSSWQEPYDKGLEIVNDKIKIVSDKINNNNNIVDDEIVKEFESIKSKLVYIPKVYSDYLENLKSENEKGKNNLIFEELVNITESKFNKSKIDSIYNELNEENKVNYGKLIDLNYLNSQKDTLYLNRLTTDYVKSSIQYYKDNSYIDNSLIIFEGEYNYGDHIAVDRGTKGYETGSGFISVINYNKYSKRNETENIMVWKNGYKNLIEVGTGYIGYSPDKTNFYFGISVDNGKTNNNKSSLKGLDGKLLVISQEISDENGLKKISNNINKKIFLSQYSNDKAWFKNVENIKNYLKVIPFQETFIFYNSTVNQSNRNKPSITFQGWDLSIGKRLFIKDKNGKNIPIPDGKYKLEDLNRIETKSGVIVKVKGISYGDIFLLSESESNKKIPPNI